MREKLCNGVVEPVGGIREVRSDGGMQDECIIGPVVV